MHLVLSAALFALIACALAQTCEPFSAAAAPQCAGLIDYPVWVPPGLSQQLLGISLTQYAPGASLLPGDCARAAIAVLCSGAFRECNPSSPQAPLPLCIDFCTRGLDTCAGIPAGQAIFNCSASDPFLGDSVKLWSGSPSCSVANASTPILYCPLPFTFHPAVQGCSMKCPPIGLDDASSNDKIWILSKVFGSTSLVLEVLILLPVWHQTKKGTLNCMLHFWIANLLGTIGTLTPRWNSWESAICSDDWTLRSSSSTTCFVTAFCNIAALTAVAYWLMFAMYSLLIRQPGFRWLALSTYLDGERLPWLTERSVLLGIGWGLPCTQFLIPLIAGWLDATTGAYSCSINPTVHNGWALNGLIYVPLTVTMTISTTIILTVMFLVVKNGFGAVRTQWRILAVGSYYICIVWIVVGYAWHSYAVRDAVTKAVETAIGASIASNGAVSYQAVYREKSPLSADFNVAVIALVTSLGTVLGLLFLVTPGHWRYYQHIFSTGRLTWSESEPGPSSGVATSRRGNSSSM